MFRKCRCRRRPEALQQQEMEGYSAPVKRQVRTDGGDGQHEQERQEVNGIDFRQPIPDKSLVAGARDAVAERIRIVISQDESAEDKEEGHAADSQIEKEMLAA